jgi:hypothetical protein
MRYDLCTPGTAFSKLWLQIVNLGYPEDNDIGLM